MKYKSQYKNPFALEDLRNFLAHEGKDKEFLKTYTGNIPVIKNPNNKIFWDKHFDKELELKDQDSMTKDKLCKILSFIPRKKNIILDIGFGQGYFEEMLQSSRKGYELHGIDISRIAVNRAKKKFNGSFKECDISSLKKTYKEHAFDIVVCIELIEHIPPKEIFIFYNSVHRILKKNGILIISTPLNEGLRFTKKNPSGHLRDYQPATIKMELEISGFRVLNSYNFYAFNKYYKVKKLLTYIFKKKWKPNNIVVLAKKI